MRVTFVVVNDDLVVENDVISRFLRKCTKADFNVTRALLKSPVNVHNLVTLGSNVHTALESLPSNADYDILVVCCTSLEAVLGSDGFNRLSIIPNAQMTLGPLRCIVWKLREIKRSNAIVLTPYGHEVNQHVVKYLIDHNINVSALTTMGIESDVDVQRVSIDDVLAELYNMTTNVECNVAIICCTSFRNTLKLQHLESILNIPVVSSNSALLDALETCYRKEAIEYHFN